MVETKRRSGRPVHGEPKNDRLSLRVSKKDKEKIVKRAEELGFKNLSDYVIFSCMSEIELNRL